MPEQLSSGSKTNVASPPQAASSRYTELRDLFLRKLVELNQNSKNGQKERIKYLAKLYEIDQEDNKHDLYKLNQLQNLLDSRFGVAASLPFFGRLVFGDVASSANKLLNDEKQEFNKKTPDEKTKVMQHASSAKNKASDVLVSIEKYFNLQCVALTIKVERELPEEESLSSSASESIPLMLYVPEPLTAKNIKSTLTEISGKTNKIQVFYELVEYLDHVASELPSEKQDIAELIKRSIKNAMDGVRNWHETLEPEAVASKSVGPTVK